jgi:hypothetical protein
VILTASAHVLPLEQANVTPHVNQATPYHLTRLVDPALSAAWVTAQWWDHATLVAVPRGTDLPTPPLQRVDNVHLTARAVVTKMVPDLVMSVVLVMDQQRLSHRLVERAESTVWVLVPQTEHRPATLDNAPPVLVLRKLYRHLVNPARHSAQRVTSQGRAALDLVSRDMALLQLANVDHATNSAPSDVPLRAQTSATLQLTAAYSAML